MVGSKWAGGPKLSVRRVVLASVVAVVVGATAALAATKSVSIVDFAFSPKATAAAQGDTVKWANSGVQAHTVTSDTGVFNSSGTLGHGATFSVAFPGAGRWTYHCSIHLSMTGEVDIKPVAPATATKGSKVTIRLASTAVKGLTYTAKIKSISTGKTMTLKAATGSTSVQWTPTATGKYSVTGITAKGTSSTKASPAVAITVS